MRNIILFSSLLLVLISCDQDGLFVSGAAKNIITAPVEGIKRATNYITGNTYDNYKDKTNKSLDQDEKKTEEDILISCTETNENALGIGVIDKLFGNVKEHVCECYTWGSCSKELCSCETLCPRDLRILNRPEMTGALSAASENSLTFLNNKRDFANSKYPLTKGYCWGHAAVTQRFNRLAFFKPEEKPEVAEGTEEWVEYYEKKIDEVINHKATNIPGFNNLEEFASEPAIQELLQEKVAKTWSEHATTLPSFFAATRTSPYKKKEIDKFNTDVVDRLNMGQKPQVIFTYEGIAFKSHVVLIHSYFYDDKGKLVLCSDDSNFMPYLNRLCLNQFVVGDEGELLYNGEKVTAARVTHNEDGEALKQMHSLTDYCLNDKDCPLKP